MRGDGLAERALVLAPRGRDAPLAVALLREAGIAAEAVESIGALIAALQGGAGLAVVAEEAFRDADLAPLAAWLGAQPPWSDLPFVLLTGRGAGPERNPAAARLWEVLGNVSFLERPFHPTTLVSLARAALRSRRRQYEACARLDELRDSREAERASAERVRLALDAGAIIGTWDWDLRSDRFAVDERFVENFGLDPAHGLRGLPLAEVIANVHPDDLAGLQAAIARVIARGGPYSHQYRVRGRDGAWRWIEANGRVDLAPDGTPARFPGVLLDLGPRRAAEAERDRAEALLRSFVEAVPGVVYAKDRAGRMLVANRGLEAVVGRPPEAVLGRTDAEYLDDPAEAAAVMANDRRIMESGVAEQVEEEVRLADGRPTIWLSTKAPLRDEAGRVVGLIGSSVNITARRATEAALRESEERLRFALDAAGGVGTWDWDVKADIVHADARFAALYGLDPAVAAGGLPVAAYVGSIHPEDRSGVSAAISEAVESGCDYSAEYRVTGHDGVTRWVIARGRCLRDGAGRPSRFPGVVLDITERKALEAAMQESEARLKAILDTVPAAVILAEAPSGRILFGNPAVERVFRHPMIHSDGNQSYRDWVAEHGDGTPVRTEEYPLARVLATGAPAALDLRYRCGDGVMRWISLSAAPVLDAAGRMGGAVMVCEDVEKERRAAEALRESEAFARRLGEVAPVLLYVYDLAQDRNAWANRELGAALGYSPQEMEKMAGRLVETLMHPDDLARVPAHLARVRALADGETAEFEYRFRRADGSWMWLASRELVFRRDAIGQPVQLMGAALDVTARKADEAELRRLNAVLEGRVGEEVAARQRLWTLAEDLFVTANFEGTLLEVSDSWTRTFGWTREELLRGSYAELIHPDDLGPVAERLAELRRTGQSVRYDNRVRARDGGWRVVAWTLAAEADGSRLYGVGRDVTAEREAARALAEAQAQLAHARRMEALGQLAGGIAHDFNNVLQAVQGGARLISRRPDEPEAVKRLARMVSEAANRGASVTRRLLAFSRRGDLRTEAVDPRALLAELREVLTHTLGAGVGVALDMPAALPALLADKGQLETVLLNLATNGRDAMGGKGLITLGAASDDVGRGGLHRTRPAEMASGRYVRLSVTDTGAGMTPEVLARATEPFFTTRGAGKGTGLGLAMARGFAEQSGGGLLIESTPGRGTTVSLWFPLAGAAPALPDVETVAVATRGPSVSRTKTVLVVDDEPLVRNLLVEGLRALDYDAVAAASGSAALAMLDEGVPVDLVVSDLSMPGMDGLELVAEVHKRRSRLPAILLTGFATNAAELALGGALSGSFSLLRKPVTPEALAERVAMLL